MAVVCLDPVEPFPPTIVPISWDLSRGRPTDFFGTSFRLASALWKNKVVKNGHFPRSKWQWEMFDTIKNSPGSSKVEEEQEGTDYDNNCHLNDPWHPRISKGSWRANGSELGTPRAGWLSAENGEKWSEFWVNCYSIVEKYSGTPDTLQDTIGCLYYFYLYQLFLGSHWGLFIALR